MQKHNQSKETERKIGRKSGSSIICDWNWIPQDTNTQATLKFIKCKHWMSRNISSFSYSDINLFFIDCACCKLCNIWLLLFENNSRSYNYTGASQWRNNIVAVITQDRWWYVIDNNLKGQIKNRTLYTCRLFLTRIFRYISNWSSKVFEYLTTLFLQYSYIE